MLRIVARSLLILASVAALAGAFACGQETHLVDVLDAGDNVIVGDGPTLDDGSAPGDAACSLCGSRCVDLTTDVANCGSCNNHCLASQVCKGGQCSCTGNQTLCGAGANAKCVDLMADATNCGTCGNACGANTTCQAGKCVCPGAEMLCATGVNAACTYLTNDHANCGGCGNACPPGGSCQNGVCACLAGQQMCGSGNTAVCSDPATDHANCGGCGMACASESACVMGKCIPCTSTTGGMMCGMPPTCVDPMTDRGNCGTCGNACLPSQICQAGKCQCLPGLILCGSGADQACVILSSDQNNCGACGVVCTNGKLCQSSVCGCPAGYHNCSGTCFPDNSPSTSSCGTTCALCPPPNNGSATCDGTPPLCGQICPGDRPTLCGGGNSAWCANTTDDTDNCGGCGNQCSTNHATPRCSNSSCSIARCNGSQFKDCDGNPDNGCEVDTNWDPNNCGGCGTRCNITSGGESCVNGSCMLGSCNSPLANCDHNPATGCNVNLSNDFNNCGSCNHVCPSGGSCSNSSCQCPQGSIQCGNSCVGCPGRPANGTLTCNADGSCVQTCNNSSLPTLCGNVCVNTQSDQGNCGGCGNPCLVSQTCQGGRCVWPGPPVAPTFNPQQGDLAGPTLITIHCEADASVLYSTDGTTPSTPLPTGVITITKNPSDGNRVQTVTIFARCSWPNGSLSSVVSQTYNLIPTTLIFVHAAPALPSLRVCWTPSDGNPPFPSRPMPLSNYGGIRVGGAEWLPDSNGLGPASQVYAIDAKALAEASLAGGIPCSQLRCEDALTCLQSGDYWSVKSDALAKLNAQLPNLIVLAGCPGSHNAPDAAVVGCDSQAELHLEVLSIAQPSAPVSGELPVQAAQLSPSLQTDAGVAVSWELQDGGSAFSIAQLGQEGDLEPPTPTLLPVGSGEKIFGELGIAVATPGVDAGAAGKLWMSLAQAQQLVRPAVAPSNYYGMPGTYVVTVLGDPRVAWNSDTGGYNGGGLHVLLLPTSAPP